MNKKIDFSDILFLQRFPIKVSRSAHHYFNDVQKKKNVQNQKPKKKKNLLNQFLQFIELTES